MARRFTQIRILSNVEAPLKVLRSDESEYDNIGIDTTHEDAHDETILVPCSLALWREREAFTDCGFDGGGRGRHQVSELIRGSYDEGAEGAGGELHEIDWDDAIGALDAELFEERCGHDGFA